MGRKLLSVAVFLCLLAGCTPDSSEPTQPEAQAPATKSVRVPVIQDFGVASARPETRLSGLKAPSIDVGKEKVAIIAVERPAVSATCITAAQLRLYLESHSDLAAAELAVYPSFVFNAVHKKDGDKYGYSGSALDTRPRATLDEAASGWSEWDVTDIVKRWVGHRPFPSQGSQAPRGAPIVLTLRDVDGAEPFATATVASAEAAKNSPYLVVTHTDTCNSA